MIAKRTRFELKTLEPMHFLVDGARYTFSEVFAVVKREDFSTNICEYILKTIDGRKIWLTVVGDEDQPSGFGILRGWYVARTLSDETADLLTKALSAFSN